MARNMHFELGSREHFQAQMGSGSTTRASVSQDKHGAPLYLKNDVAPEPNGDGFAHVTHAYRLQGDSYKHVGMVAQDPMADGRMYTVNAQVHSTEQRKGIGTAMLTHSVDHPRFLAPSNELSHAGTNLQNSMRGAHEPR